MKLRFNIEADDQVTRWVGEVEVSVDTDGIFSTRVPEDFQKNVRAFTDSEENKYKEIKLYTWRDTTRISSPTLGALKGFINLLAKDYLKVEATEKLVIVYGYAAEVSLWINPDGTVAPNGYAGKEGGRWWKPQQPDRKQIHATEHVELYNVGFAAEVFLKKTWKRPSGERHVYERVDGNGPNNDKDTPAAARRLNSFVGLDIRPGQGWQDSKWEEMDYTDEAAEFFTNVLLNLGKLAAQIDSFFGHKETLQLAIEKGMKLLGG